jgi:hypothetical protein
LGYLKMKGRQGFLLYRRRRSSSLSTLCISLPYSTDLQLSFSLAVTDKSWPPIQTLCP